MAHSADARIDRSAGLAYWNSIDATVNGMLGGFPQISRIDLVGSANFLTKLRRQFPSTSQSSSTSASDTTASSASSSKSRLPPLGRAVDCGAGIGRITHGLLSNVAQTVDIVEPVEKFTTEITSGKSFATLREQGKIGRVYNVGLEAWDPTRPEKEQIPVEASDSQKPEDVEEEKRNDGDPKEPQRKKQKTSFTGSKYDLIWNQWCVGHLTDAQLVAYLRRCGLALTPGGWIIVKENNTTSSPGSNARPTTQAVKPKSGSNSIKEDDEDEGGWIDNDAAEKQEQDDDLYDEVDSSVTRSDSKFRSLFKQAGLNLVKSELQSGFPRGLFPVRFYALQPQSDSAPVST